MSKFLFDIAELRTQFDLPGVYAGSCAITDGNINKTFKVDFLEDGKIKSYLLQEINIVAFKDPEALMDNIVRVTQYLRNKIAENGGDPERGTLTFLPASDGKYYYKDVNGRIWRICNFVRHSHAYNYIDSAETYLKAGIAFGDFCCMLDGFPIDTLHETIPMFHNTANRFKNLKIAAEKNTAGRLDSVKPELEFAYSKEADAHVLTDMIEAGELPLRVTHNDTKLNNVLFDDVTNDPVCVIDLDTVMPGLSLYDFGDSIRYAANTAKEDETDLSKVSIDVELYRAYLVGFLNTAGKSMSEKEIMLLPFSCKIMAYECGIRFLTDYLDGDVYFKTLYPTHNIDRCRCQFALVKDIEMNMDELKAITKEVYDSLV